MQRLDGNSHIDPSDETGARVLRWQRKLEIFGCYSSKSVHKIWFNPHPCWHGAHLVHYWTSYASYAQRNWCRFDLRFRFWHCSFGKYFACSIHLRLFVRDEESATFGGDYTKVASAHQWEINANIHLDAYSYMSELSQQGKFLGNCWERMCLLVFDWRFCHWILQETCHWQWKRWNWQTYCPWSLRPYVPSERLLWQRSELELGLQRYEAWW